MGGRFVEKVKGKAMQADIRWQCGMDTADIICGGNAASTGTHVVACMYVLFQ